MDGRFSPTMSIMRVLPKKSEARNQWERAHPIRLALEHAASHPVRLPDVHFSDSQQLFGPHDEHNLPRMVTWTGSFHTPDGIRVKIAAGDGKSKAGDVRMHALIQIETPGHAPLDYYVQRPEQHLPAIYHSFEPDSSTVLEDVKEEEYRHLASLLAQFNPRRLPIPRPANISSQDRTNPSLVKRADVENANRQFAEDFRPVLLKWFQENAT